MFVRLHTAPTKGRSSNSIVMGFSVALVLRVLCYGCSYIDRVKGDEAVLTMRERHENLILGVIF